MVEHNSDEVLGMLKAMAGRGEVNIELLIEGKLANVVRVAIR